MENLVFKLLSNEKMCTVNRINNEKMVRIALCDEDLKQLVQKTCQISIFYRSIQVVELIKTVVLCLFDPEANANNISPSRIIKYDFDLNVMGEAELAFEIIHADAYYGQLYFFATSSDRKSKHIYVYGQSLKMLGNIQLSSSEGLPFYVPDSATKMRVDENYFVFLDDDKVLLMDRDDGMIKRTFSIGSSDFVLDSNNDRILAYDGKTEKLVCFDFQGDSFEISISNMKNFELVSYAYDRFMFFDPNSFSLHF